MENNRPFRFWCQKVLPLVYDDSLSYYELLCKVVNYLNSLIEDTKILTTEVNEVRKAISELKKYVDNYFDNLDLQTEIDSKIDKLIQTGAFQEMLMKTIGNGQGVQIGEYLGTRYIRMCDAPYNSDDIDYTRPAEGEGVCQVDDKTIICFYSPFAQGITETSQCIIEEYNFNEPLNPVRVRSARIANVQHANGCTYYNGKIYVALWGYYKDSVSVPSPKIAIVNYKTLTVDEIITISGIPAVQKITVDKTTGKFYVMNGRAVYELNLTSKTVTPLFTAKVPVSSSQGMEARGGILYLSHGCPFGISAHSLSGDGSVLRWIDISNIDSCNHYFGRIADLALIDNYFYINTHQVIEQANYGINPEVNPTIYANYFIKVGLFGGQYEGSTNASLYENNRLKIDTTLFEEKLIYADGSVEHPFPTLGECLQPQRYRYRLVATENITYRGVLPVVSRFLAIPDEIEVHCSGLYLKDAYFSCDRVVSSKHYEILRSTAAINALSTNELNGNILDHSTALFFIHDENVSLHTSTVRQTNVANNTQFTFTGGQSKGIVMRFTGFGTLLGLKKYFTNLSWRVGMSVNIGGITETVFVNLAVTNKINVGGTEVTITPDTTNITLTFSTAPVVVELWLI